MNVSEGQLYAATVADFSGGEPLIHREKIRTERSDLNQLNGNGTLINCIPTPGQLGALGAVIERSCAHT